MKRALRYTMIPAAAAVMALPAVAVPASAHLLPFRVDGVYRGEVRGYGEVGPQHHVVRACDTNRDGYGVRVVVGNGQVVRDRNGSDPGCGERHFARTINEFKVCITDDLVEIACTRKFDA